MYESMVVLHILQAQLEIISHQPDAWVVYPTLLTLTPCCAGNEAKSGRSSLVPRPHPANARRRVGTGHETMAGLHCETIASFPGSSAPERDIEVVHAERACYLFSREHHQR